MINMRNPFDLLLVWLGTVGLSEEDSENLMKGKDRSLGARHARAAAGKEQTPPLEYRIQETEFGPVAVIKHPYGMQTEEIAADAQGNPQTVLSSGLVCNQTVLRTTIKSRRDAGKDTTQEEKILQELEAATEQAGLTDVANTARTHGFLTGGLEDGMFYISRITGADPKTGEAVYPEGTEHVSYPGTYGYLHLRDRDGKHLKQPAFLKTIYPPPSKLKI